MLLKLKKHLQLLILMLTPFLMVACESDDDVEDTTSTLLGTKSYTVSLTSKFTVPQITANGNGSATLTLDLDTGSFTGSVTLDGLTDDATAVHIHQAIAGLTGAVIIPLAEVTGNPNLFNIPDATILSSTQISAIQNSEFYLNVHTTTNTSGEIRGQIVGENQEVIKTELSGDNQVPTSISTSNSGVAYITVNKSSREIRGNIKNTGLDDATAVHIHDGFAGTNGSVITALTQDTDVSVWNIESGTILDSAQLSNLLAGGMYFNVHSPANANGEIRGQVIPAGIEHERVELSGDYQVPTAVSSAGSAVAYITVNETSGAITAHVITESLTDTTAAHIHSGYAGTNGGVVLALTQDVNNFSTTSGDVLDSTALTNLFAGNLYFNIHTATNTAGDVRGQIATGDIKVTRDLLNGDQTVPMVTTSATGVGYTTVNEADGTIIANVRTTGLTATAAHVHQGTVGNTGPVAVTLTQDGTDTDFWSSTGTLDSTQLDAFKSSELYFNVHSDAHASGEIRAQINH